MAEDQNQPDKNQENLDELSKTDKPQRKNSRSRRRLVVFGILSVILIIVSIVFFNLPQRIGLVQSPTEKEGRSCQDSGVRDYSPPLPRGAPRQT